MHKKAEESSSQLTRLSVCVRFRCVRGKLLTQHSTVTPTIPSVVYARFGPGTWDWTRIHALVVMHRRTLCENVDSAKIKVPFYTTEIKKNSPWHRIVIHRIDITIHIDESLHPYAVYEAVYKQYIEDLTFAQVRLLLLYDSFVVLVHDTKCFQNLRATAKMSQVILLFL